MCERRGRTIGRCILAPVPSVGWCQGLSSPRLRLPSDLPSCSHPIRRPRSMDLPQPLCQPCKRAAIGGVQRYPKSVKGRQFLPIELLTEKCHFVIVGHSQEEFGKWLATILPRLAMVLRALYGSRYVNQFPTWVLPAHGHWLEMGLDSEQPCGPRIDLINLPSLAHMLMLVDFLFGSWTHKW